MSIMIFLNCTFNLGIKLPTKFGFKFEIQKYKWKGNRKYWKKEKIKEPAPGPNLSLVGPFLKLVPAHSMLFFFSSFVALPCGACCSGLPRANGWVWARDTFDPNPGIIIWRSISRTVSDELPHNPGRTILILRLMCADTPSAREVCKRVLDFLDNQLVLLSHSRIVTERTISL